MAQISKSELVKAVTAITVAKITNSAYHADDIVELMDKVADEIIVIAKKLDN